MKSTGNGKKARCGLVETSTRLQRTLKLLSDGIEHTSLEIAQYVPTPSASQCVQDLRLNGYTITTRCEKIEKSTRYYYRLLEARHEN